MDDLRFARIRFKDRPAGVLAEESGGRTVFEYHSDFRETIGCALPRDEDVHEWAGGLHPFFQHLGPEGWLRGSQARTAELSVEDDLGLLLRFGADCMGAVSVHDPEDARAVDPIGALDFMTLAAVESRRTLSGVQPKLLVRAEGDRFLRAGPGGPAPYIAKFPTTDLPELVQNESLSLELARLFLGDAAVTAAHVARVEGIAPPALLVRRFDRTAAGDKLRLEDFAQILSVPRGRDFSGKYDSSYEDAAVAIVRHSAAPRLDLSRYFERILVSFVLGDCDCHLKNFSLLETLDGLRLSPAYDIVNTVAFASRGFSTRFGLRLGGGPISWEGITRDVLKTFARDIGLPARAAERSLARFGRTGDFVLARLRPLAESTDSEWQYAYWSSVLDALTRLRD